MFGPSLPSLTSDLTLAWPAGFSKRVASGTQGSLMLTYSLIFLSLNCKDCIYILLVKGVLITEPLELFCDLYSSL